MSTLNTSSNSFYRKTDNSPSGGLSTKQQAVLNTLSFDSSGNLSTSTAFDIESNAGLAITGTQVLTSTTLLPSVVNSSLTSVGTLKGLSVTGNVQASNEFVCGGNNNLVVTPTSIYLNDASLGVGSYNPGVSINIASPNTRNAGALQWFDGSGNLAAGIYNNPNNQMLYIYTNTSTDWIGFGNSSLPGSATIQLSPGSNGWIYAGGGVDLILSGGVYQINGSNVLTSSTLGSTVTSSSLTSLGTLTGLSVKGAASFSNCKMGIDDTSNTTGNMLDVSGNINTSTGYYIGSTSVLSGTTLGTGITTSNLTSVGTLTSLAVTGSVAVGKSTATNPVDVSGNIAISGYVKIGSNYATTVASSGIQIKYGTGNISSTTSGTISYGYTFTSIPYVYTTLNSTSATQILTINNATTTGFSYGTQSVSVSSVNWLAIGPGS